MESRGQIPNVRCFWLSLRLAEYVADIEILGSESHFTYAAEGSWGWTMNVSINPANKWKGAGTALVSILLLPLGVHMNVAAKSVTWKEEVQLHDGTTIIATRSLTISSELEPIQAQSLTFGSRGGAKLINWKVNLSKEVGHADLEPIALDIVDGRPYLVTVPSRCIAYNKWQRPNPPYVAFAYRESGWARISLDELPKQISSPNLLMGSKRFEEIKAREQESGVLSAIAVREMNRLVDIPELKVIARQPLPKGSHNTLLVNCEELVYHNGYWVQPGNSLGRKFANQFKK